MQIGPTQVVADAYNAIRTLSRTVCNPSQDESFRKDCKQELYHLQCWLNDEYKNLPVFDGEEKWEQDRIIKILKE